MLACPVLAVPTHIWHSWLMQTKCKQGPCKCLRLKKLPLFFTYSSCKDDIPDSHMEREIPIVFSGHSTPTLKQNPVCKWGHLTNISCVLRWRNLLWFDEIQYRILTRSAKLMVGAMVLKDGLCLCHQFTNNLVGNNNQQMMLENVKTVSVRWVNKQETLATNSDTWDDTLAL